VAPALKASRRNPAEDLKAETRGGSAGREHNRMRTVLVGGQIAMALFLLIGSCLLIRAVYLVDHQKLGFAHDHLLTAGIVLDKTRYADTTKQIEFAESLGRNLREVPGVQGAAVGSDLPSTGPGSVTIHIKGQAEAKGIEQRTALDTVVSSAYFDTAGIPVLRGRGLAESDNAGAPRVMVVNQQFAQKYFPGEDPLGKQMVLDIPGTAAVTCAIVGVVADVKTYSEDPRVQPQMYESYLQRPVTGFSIMVRSSADPGSVATGVRQAVSRLDPELPLQRLISMDGVIDLQRAGNPLFSKMLATFAALALVLAAIGIYGLIAYSVGQRSHEFGIRLALGAKASDISRMVLRDGLKVAVVGCAIGFALALPLPKVFESIFQGLLVSSPAVYPLVLVVMLLVVAAATLGPARRAMRVDPTSALRNE
jgi:putative ABC transport system permease protein